MNAKTVLVQSIAASLLIASGTTVAAQVTKQQVVEHYADVAHAVFADSLTTAKTLEVKIDEFLKAPSEAKLEDVKQAWLESRVPYQQSEVFRFGNAVVDDWEGQLNAWPLDEGLIDYVAADYQYELGNEGAAANIIANTSLTIGPSKLDVAKITPELLA
ncbi:imelysin family protein, partial [Vibrio parahaemolyticus]|nr:imelysin family protein [Vibrio parahaemolyticus]